MQPEAQAPHRRQFDLYRPLPQLGGNVRSARRAGVQFPALTAGTSAGFAPQPRLIGAHRRFIVGRGFPLYKGDGPRGAGGQTVAQTITVIVPQKAGFSIYHADGIFVAGFGTQAAAVAFFLIDVNDFANHMKVPPLR